MSINSSDTDAEDHSFSERTLAIIKPEAYEDAEDIEDHIRNHGFQILAVCIQQEYIYISSFSWYFRWCKTLVPCLLI